MKKLIFVLMLGLTLAMATSASAVSVSATATADNWLWVWTNTWNDAGANYWKWQVADTTTFELPYSQTASLYFAVMNETQPAGSTYVNSSGLLAQLSGVRFLETGTNKLLSNTADYWKVAAVTANTWNPNWDGVRPPETRDYATNPADPVFNPADISNWGTPVSYGANNAGGNPWGSVNGIDGNAEWIWTANNWEATTPDNLAVFKVTATPVPEPASAMLLSMGLIGFAGRLIRRKFTV